MRAELAAYGHGLTDKPEIVALNKSDALMPAEARQQMAELRRAVRKKPFLISAVSGDGVPDVLRALLKVIEDERQHAAAPTATQAAWHP